jgi:hypothetical protein
MTVADEPTGLSRRSMLKRSAVVGGTLLWVTPTVTVLSAGPAAAGSPTPRGDGTPLKASYYILAIRCGTTKYLIKVNAPDSKHPDSFWLEYGPAVKGAADDPNDGWPSSETKGIAQKYKPFAAATATPPADVAIYVVKGMLYLDLDLNHDAKKPGGSHCELLSWIGHKGTVFYKAGGLAKAYDPQVIDPERPYLLAFPLLKNQNGNT